MSTHDVAIVGGSAAGLSAALVLSRARRRVVVIDSGRPRNAPAAHMHGYLSRDGLAPSELLAIGRAEVTSYGGTLLDDTVDAAVRLPGGLLGLSLRSGASVNARRLLVATGLRDVIPDVPGLAERWGRDVLHCPYCHGHEVRDQPIGVLGGTPGAVQHALLIRQWSDDVVFFPHTTQLSDAEQEQLAARRVDVIDGVVERVVSVDGRIAGVALGDDRFVARTAIFVRPEFVSNDALLAELGVQTDHGGWPLVDPTGLTTAPHIWVAGNVANPRAQVITAAGEGSAAAIAINNDLTDEDVRDAVEALRKTA